MTREEIEQRCEGCEHLGRGIGVCVPSLRSLICLASPRRKVPGAYWSIYQIEDCPRPVRAAAALRGASRQ